MKKLLFLLVCVVLVLLASPVAVALADPGYSHDSAIGLDRPDWMAALPDLLRVSELSIPGTHDTMARHGGDLVETQSMNLATQLYSGIRALDIRCRNDHDEFSIWHGIFFQDAWFGRDVLNVCKDFLQSHPTETILMRIKKERDDDDCTRSFNDTFADYRSWYPGLFWDGWSSVPTLGEARGKIVLLQDFGGLLWGLNYNPPPGPAFCIQDDYEVATVWGIDDKWNDDVRPQMQVADVGDRGAMYLNFLSGVSSGAYPYTVASGDVAGVEWVTGVNDFAYDYLSGRPLRMIGTCFMDFPGAGLVDAIIALNPWNHPPVAEAGGPYAVDEGTVLTLSAAGSSDADGDPLTYRWDFDNDGTWDTASSPSPLADKSWPDNSTETVKVWVSDGNFEVTDVATVTIWNAPPSASIDSMVQPDPYIVLPVVHELAFSGSFADPGTNDTHTAGWDWGDGSAESATLSEVSGAGTVSGTHTYQAPGIYTVTLDVVDDDGGSVATTWTVTVHSAGQATAILRSYVESLPDSAFAKRASRCRPVLLLKIDAILKMISEDAFRGAIESLLRDVRAQSDRSGANDWVDDPAASQAICHMVDDLCAYMETLL